MLQRGLQRWLMQRTAQSAYARLVNLFNHDRRETEWSLSLPGIRTMEMGVPRGSTLFTRSTLIRLRMINTAYFVTQRIFKAIYMISSR